MGPRMREDKRGEKMGPRIREDKGRAPTRDAPTEEDAGEGVYSSSRSMYL